MSLGPGVPASLALRSLPLYGGRGLVATRTFTPGSTVLLDRPLLATDEDSEVLDRVYEAHDALGIRADLCGKDASIDFSLQLLAYCRAPADVRLKVHEMFSPNAHASRESPYVRAAQQYATAVFEAQRRAPAAFASSLLAPLAGLSKEEAAEHVLVWVCNSYAYVKGGGSLLQHGSLVNHCCTGCTRCVPGQRW